MQSLNATRAVSIMRFHHSFSTCYVQLMSCLLVVVILVGSAPPSGAQEIDPQNVVIENVHIATADAEDVSMSLLIRDNNLEQISKDEIPIPDNFVSLDANGGYLVGNLALGESRAL